MANLALPRESSVKISAHCQVCGGFPAQIIDAPHVSGPWAYMCIPCYKVNASESASALGTLHQNVASEVFEV